jgi:hypothetical protein
MGDAICSFNPVYGQGMTVAALEAEALQECLDDGTGQLASRFFKKASRVLDTPWNTSVGNDRRLTEPERPGSPLARFIQWYMGKLHIAARRDPAVALAFLKVTNLMAPPLSVLYPPIALRVLWGNRPPVKAEASTANKTATTWVRGWLNYL